MAERLLKLLPSIFPSNTNTPELSTLFHGDLSMRNILIDDDGKITGIIDWECVSALPLWRASKPPGFLQGKERNEDPKRD
jgi:Ser/Thr protein kinase RdoA (MazF antagonist)